MDFEEWSALKKSGKSVLWPHRHIIRKARVRHHSWAEIAELLETKGVRVHFTNIQKWYARQDWDQIDAELSPKPQAQAVARPAVPRPASPRPTPREPTQVSQGLGLVEKYAPNPQPAGVDDEDDNNPAHSVLAKFPGTAKRMQEKTDGNQS